MSGIAAIFCRDGQFPSRSDIERIARSLRIYGPERLSVRLVGPVAFAYAHFTDTPEARTDNQPIVGGEGRYVMVFDGRLDNRQEIANKLNIDQNRLVSYSDSQLAILSWEKWGGNSVHHWIGEFAFILWDKTEGYLRAARDQFGARTLHYNENSNRLILASAPKCIHALGDLSREIDEQKIADALSQLYFDAGRTFFKGISRIPPASELTASDSSLKVSKYYHLSENVSPIRYKSDMDYVENAKEIFFESVRATLRSVRPVGSFLSGGLDSSSMSVYAAQELEAKGQKLISFTSVPEEGWDQREIKSTFGNEEPFVRDIANHNSSIEINFVDGAGYGHYHKQEELLFALEMPVRNALNLQWTHAILEKAKERGVGVMLQGVYGNATLSQSGDGVFGELLKNGDFLQAYRELAAISRGPKHFMRNILKHLVYPLGPNWLWQTKEKLRGRKNSSENWKRFSVLTSEFAQEMDIPQRIQQAGYTYFGGKPKYSRELWYNILANWNTETGDIMQGLRAMYKIDIRDPFANRRLIEWCFGLPENQFHRNGTNRWLIRRMMAGLLPESVINNKKTGLQTADWHLRLTRDLPRIQRELDNVKQDQYLSKMVDLQSLEDLVKNWPEHTVTDLNDDRFFQIPNNLPMALQISRFVQRERGSNTPSS